MLRDTRTLPPMRLVVALDALQVTVPVDYS
jgi:hypothetical protein